MRTNHVLGVSAAVVLSAAIAASAQVTRPTAQPPLPTPPAPALNIQKTGEAVTLTGCVKAASAPAAAEVARPQTAPGGMALATNSYLLTNVEDKEQPSNKAGKTYALVAGTGVNIGEHLNHRVQVQGIIEKIEPPIAKPSATAGEEKTGDRPPTSNWPVITVTSLMMVSSACGTTLHE